MAALNAACLFNHPQITGILDDSFMALFLVNGKGITEMAGGTAYYQPVMGRIEFFLGVTAQAHLNLAGGCLVELIRPLGHVLADHQAKNQEKEKKNR